MTYSTAARIEQSERRGRRRRKTFASDLAEGILYELQISRSIQWPSPRYRANPVGFIQQIIGAEPWEKQIEVIEAVRDHMRVAVRSGHKVSKSHTAAAVALWFYCSFPDARVIMTSTTARQVDQILWRELKMMRARAGRCVECKEAGLTETPCEHSSLIDGEIGELARTGLKSIDFREVVGFTAKEAEAVAGISGRNLLYIVDEASGVAQEIFDAIEGNRAGGARILLLGNPTKNEGEHYDAFHSKSDFYHTITISSEETPNVKQGRAIIPGLATLEWIDEKKQEWGEKSSLYLVRVKGVHATKEDGKIFSIHTITMAEQRWYEVPEQGRLYIGLDPAGPTGSGDETVFAPRRGFKVLTLRFFQGLSEEAHLIHLRSIIGVHKLPRETPVVVVDREGAVGSRVYGTLRAYIDNNPGAFELVGVRASDRAVREPQVYDRMRDELTANLEHWFRDGGSIPEDTKLAAELHQPEWKQQANGRLKVTPKDVIKKKIGRSPDRYDAVALSTWEPLALREDEDAPGLSAAARAATVDDTGRIASLDPYAGSRVWEGRGRG